MTPNGPADHPNEPERASAAASLVGTTLGDRYRLLEVLGEGGMGSVFRASQVGTGQTVALKLLHPELCVVPQIVSRFEREAEVLARLSHPHIVKVVEFGEVGGRLFLAMEFLQGRSLAALLDKGESQSARRPAGRGHRLTTKRTIAIMRQVLGALHHAHALGVVHRDLKPENIMLVTTGRIFSREQVKLLDYGIAMVGGEAGAKAKKLTQQGFALGTPEYMAPEQAVGQTADARCDVYSCGVVIYEMLTGRRPFESDSIIEVLGMQINTAPKPLRIVAPDARITVAMESVVLRALAKRPDDRFQSASELREALERAARSRDNQSIVSGLETTMLALPTTPQANRRRRSAGAVVFALVTAGAVIADHHLQVGDFSKHAPRETSDSTRKPAKSASGGAVRSPPPRELASSSSSEASTASVKQKDSPARREVPSKKLTVRRR